MSNLSELLPAGAGAKSADFVASGTLSSGQTVVLKADGTVSSVTQTSSSSGTPVAFNAGSARTYRPVAVVYHPVQDKTVFFYKDSGGSNAGKAIVGTVSGATISFAGASEYEFESNAIGEVLTAVYDSNIDRIVVFYELTANNRTEAKVVTVSGNTLSFSGSSGVGGTTNYENGTTCFDSVANKIIFAASSQTSSGYGEARVITATTSTGAGGVTSGSPVIFQSNSVASMQAVYDENSDKTVIVYAQGSFGAKAIVGTVSGTAITFGTAGTVSTAGNGSINVAAAYDSDNYKVVAAYRTDVIGDSARSCVGTVSGTDITFGSETEYLTDSADHTAIVYDKKAKKIVIAFCDDNSDGELVEGTVSGDTISFTSPTVFVAASINDMDKACVYDSTAEKTVFAYQLDSNKDEYAFVHQSAATDASDFIGITDQAIADTATGAVIVQGGVITNTGLIPVAAVSFGTASSPASQGMFNTRMAYDSTSNKIVLAYEDQSNSNYGTAVIGTISGTTISWGTPVVFNSASTADGSIDVVYDPDQNKSVIVYRDIGNSGYGTAIVGTVSGTTISFGSEVVFSTRSSYYINATYDAAQDKVLIVFADGTAPSYAYTGYMVVGTVSGSSISFGSEVQFESSTISGTALALQYDASASKSLIVYAVSSANYAASITISGTTPSIGTKNNWASTSARNTEAVYIASSSKCVFAYSTTATDSPSFSAVATIDSGTGNVTVAASSSIVSATAQNERGLAYDIGAGSLVYVYNATNNYMSVVLGSISGDSVTWGEPTVLDSSGYANANFPATVYNSTEEKTVIAYRNATDSQSVVTNITANTPLTTGSDYYVQADGTLSTTVSSVPAGRALSSTSILLEG